jgi:adenosylhomocysteine nucleosidase
MESQVAARFARQRNLPLAALRVISDDASHVLPPAALVAMKPDGRLALGRVLLSLLKKPKQVPALVRTARDSNKAFAGLLRCRDLCGVGLAGADL